MEQIRGAMTNWDNITFKNESDMTNAKEELQSLLEKLKQQQLNIVCAEITYEVDYDGSEMSIQLPLAYTEAELEQFFKQLDFRYNSGFGTQCLYGTVWMSYGVWLSRWEYDGSEGWQVNKQPTIPQYLRKTN